MDLDTDDEETQSFYYIFLHISLASTKEYSRLFIDKFGTLKTKIIRKIKWIRISNNIILGINMNDDVHTGKLSRRLQFFGHCDTILFTRPFAYPLVTFN